MLGKLDDFGFCLLPGLGITGNFGRFFLHFVLDTTEYGGGTDLLCEFFWKPSSVPTRSIGYFKLSTSYVLCMMHALPSKKNEKKVSQRNKNKSREDCKAGDLLPRNGRLYPLGVALYVPWCKEHEFRDGETTVKWMGYVGVEMMLFGDQFLLFRKKHVVDVCMKIN